MASPHKQFPIWAKTKLLSIGLSQTELALKIGYSRTATTAAVNGSTKFPHVTAAIAKALHHDPETDCPLPVSPARPERRVRLAASGAR